MTDFFGEDPDVEAWTLPGDEEAVAAIEQTATTGETEPAATPAAEETPAVVEEVAPEAPADRPRNPDGTFAAKEPAPEAADEQAAERLLAGNFKTADELERAYEELRSLNGRQGQELGELRHAFEAKFAALDEKLDQRPAAPPVQITSDLIETNPAYAAQLAYEQDNGTAFQIAFEQWKEDDPFTAAAWASGKQTEQQIADLRREHKEQLSAVQSQLAPVAQTAQVAQINALIAQAETTSPGLTAFVASDKVAEIAQEFPEVAAALLSGTPDQKVRSLQTLHQIARGRDSDNLQVTQQQIARQQAEEAQQVRDEAFVASATTTSAGVKPSLADQIAAEWEQEDAVFTAGWNV